MYERFTDRSRKIMQLANAEAEVSHSTYIQTEHVLIALLQEGNGVAAHILQSLDVSEEAIRRAIGRLRSASLAQDPGGNSIPPLMKFVEASLEEAKRLGHNYVGSEHMLLALSRDPQCTAAKVLAELGLVLAEVRAEVLMLLGHQSEG